MAVSARESIKGPYRTWHSVDGDKGSRQKPFRISAAHDEWNHLAIPLVAMERGFFAQEGLSHVRCIFARLQSGQAEYPKAAIAVTRRYRRETSKRRVSTVCWLPPMKFRRT